MKPGTERPRDPLLFRLDPDEALVLFELLSRWISDRDAPTPGSEFFESSAELSALHALLASLEKVLVEPFDADYLRQRDSARERLAATWTGTTLRD